MIGRLTPVLHAAPPEWLADSFKNIAVNCERFYDVQDQDINNYYEIESHLETEMTMPYESVNEQASAVVFFNLAEAIKEAAAYGPVSYLLRYAVQVKAKKGKLLCDFKAVILIHKDKYHEFSPIIFQEPPEIQEAS